MIEKLKSYDLSVLNLCDQYVENEKSHILLNIPDTPKDEEKEQSLGSSLHHEQPDDGETNHLPLIALEDNEQQNTDSMFHFEADPRAADHEKVTQIEPRDESSHNSSQDQHLQQIAPLNDSRNFCHMATDSNNSILGKSDAFPSNLGKYTGNMRHANAPVGGVYPLSSVASEIRPAVGLPNAYCHQPKCLSHGYASINDLSLGHP